MAKQLSPSKFFETVLRAKLKNIRQSWGAFDRTRRVFLLLWKGRIQASRRGERIEVGWKDHAQSFGQRERLTHLAAIKAGTEGFGVICTERENAKPNQGRIKSYDDTVLVRVGEITEDAHHFYARIEARIPIEEIIGGGSSERDLADDLVKIIRQSDTKPTTIKALVDARLGQGEFRSNVLRLWGECCAVCGSSTLPAIRASHIKPWRDSSNDERLNPSNGLPLVANLDALFDAGLITFEPSGRMLVSSKLKPAERSIFGLAGKSLRKKPTNETEKYLLHHRAKTFKA